MKLGIIFIAGLLTISGAQSSFRGQSADDKASQQWLEQRYTEATSIKPGMSRADLLKLFTEDGGLQSIPAGTYVLRSCQLIKIAVKFDTKYGVEYKPTPDDKLKIIEVSRPYLERMAVD
ncbi:MAG TPA: hypothetical protein VE863_03950 [Pyrinomonadaceae bacterium]|jgi:hypothetical protein|nr:hypothetical protein [Pyrinomonadaceae bacterium]